MARLNAYTSFANPGLHLWREGTPFKVWIQPTRGTDGWYQFDYPLETHFFQSVRFMLFDHGPGGSPDRYEKDEHQRVLPRLPDGSFADVWFAEDAARVLTHDPREERLPSIRLHLITRRAYRPAQVYLWDPVARTSRRCDAVGMDDHGPVFDVPLHGQEQSFVHFKFIRQVDGRFDAFEKDVANRLWTARDGGEIWTHSEADAVTPVEPPRRQLRLHVRQELPASQAPRLRYWQSKSDFVADAEGSLGEAGWWTYDIQLYTGFEYGLRLFWGADGSELWEHEEAKRFITIEADVERWTLEGDSTLFAAQPRPTRTISLEVVNKPPFSKLGDTLFAHVWINHARAPLHQRVAVSPEGKVSFAAYPDVVTSILFHDGQHWEGIRRHSLRVAANEPAPARLVVLERPPLLLARPPSALFADPPFHIRRPGVYEEDGHLHFVLHAPGKARVRLRGEWMDGTRAPVELQSTRDGTYWWARLPAAEVAQAMGGDYHGARYDYLFDDDPRPMQDPAAGWVEDSRIDSASRLVRQDGFAWHDQGWQRPGKDYLTIYQLHVKRFSGRFGGRSAFAQVAEEIRNQAGYLRDLGVTALLLLPVNEVPSAQGWGYDPAFFYAVECGYGGPDGLKELVDVAHQHGMAVIVDVVFNHAGTADNILWAVARDSFFDGDTRWGAMINFDHPQCVHFFAQNLVYLAREFHLDGFRLDHTHTIIHSRDGSDFVRERGSGGGWEFLHALRHALHTEVDDRCLLMAEHLPNEWFVTRDGGPMDTQWCDAFHDQLVKACRGELVMPALADALKLGHTACDEWFQVTNYPESHDEVGNVNDRISNVAYPGRGSRMSKVAAAVSLLSRGIPMFFMGAESAEERQFLFGADDVLDLGGYLASSDRCRVRAWWREMCRMRTSPVIRGPSPIDVRVAEGHLLAFTRGQGGEIFVVANFGSGTHRRKPLTDLNLPDGVYRELWNSTWPAFAVEHESEHTNGGRDARLHRGRWLDIPADGAVVLERVG
jgi:1,4-alpha-glucan branching enzyme